jgi:hypothetical protein
VRLIHQQDLAAGLGAVWLPHALARKYPSAPREPGGSTCFPPTSFRVIRATVGSGDIMWMRAACSARCGRHGRGRASSSRRPAIRCAIRLPLTCWRQGRTSARSRSCWGTRMWRPRPLLRIHAPAALAHPCAAQIYTHVLNRGGQGVLSPLDR